MQRIVFLRRQQGQALFRLCDGGRVFDLHIAGRHEQTAAGVPVKILKRLSVGVRRNGQGRFLDRL